MLVCCLWLNMCFYALAAHSGERGNVIVMYGCVCVLSRSEPDALWPNSRLHSFCSWLIWKVNSSSLRRCKKFCRVTWPWPIYLAPKWPPDENRVFFAMFSRFVRKRTEISKLLQWTAIRKVGMGFPTTPKSAPQLDPFPPFGGSKTWKKTRKMGFTTFKW